MWCVSLVVNHYQKCNTFWFDTDDGIQSLDEWISLCVYTQCITLSLIRMLEFGCDYECITFWYIYYIFKERDWLQVIILSTIALYSLSLSTQIPFDT